MTARIIETEADIAEGADWLARTEPRFAHAIAVAGPVPLRRRPGGFEGLLRVIVGQQLSVAAADGIWRRLESAGCVTPERLSSKTDVELRACGLSTPKLRAARNLAEAAVDYSALATMDVDEARAALCALKGVGPWTAEVYLMFCVGRADVFAPADLGLQEGARLLFDLAERPDPKALAARAEAWSPWRAVAARILWAYYGAAKGRQGVIA
jgi:DNA-3-methyladenine glycosylase II